MKIYVLIEWFFEGDGYLVPAYVNVFKTYDEALNHVLEVGAELVTVFVPAEDGIGFEPIRDEGFYGWGCDSRFEIREKTIS